LRSAFKQATLGVLPLLLLSLRFERSDTSLAESEEILEKI
jgi:hypothetical protein